MLKLFILSGYISSQNTLVQELTKQKRGWVKMSVFSRGCGNYSTCCMLSVYQVLLFAERNKVPGMKRLLEAGGAQVLTPSSHKAATHAFISISYFPKDSVSIVHCMPCIYIYICMRIVHLNSAWGIVE